MRPFCSFSGDTDKDYAVLALDKGYRDQVVVGMIWTAALSLGLDIGPGTVERWRRCYAWIYYIDKMVDDAVGSRSASLADVYATLFRFISGEEAASTSSPTEAPELLAIVRLFNNSYVGFDRTELLVPMSEFATYALRKATQRNVWPYSYGLAREGRFCGDVLVACLTAEERMQPGAKAFVAWMKSCAMFFTLADSLRDLGEDYQNGITLVRKNVANWLVMFVSASVAGLWLLRRPKIFRALFVGGVRGRRFQHLYNSQNS